MYVNAFLFGVMCTLFAEMALVLLVSLIAALGKHRKKHRDHY